MDDPTPFVGPDFLLSKGTNGSPYRAPHTDRLDTSVHSVEGSCNGEYEVFFIHREGPVPSPERFVGQTGRVGFPVHWYRGNYKKTSKRRTTAYKESMVNLEEDFVRMEDNRLGFVYT